MHCLSQVTGLDPTNRCTIGENFVKIAVGRDFRDVAPNRGVYRGTATENIRVTVQSQRLRHVPAYLDAERFETLPVATLEDQTPLSHQLAAHQQERQQQQQYKFPIETGQMQQ